MPAESGRSSRLSVGFKMRLECRPIHCVKVYSIFAVKVVELSCENPSIHVLSFRVVGPVIMKEFLNPRKLDGL